MDLLESRMLLSASPAGPQLPADWSDPSSSELQLPIVYVNGPDGSPLNTSGPSGGLTAQELRQVLGLNNITFDNGTVAGDGTGQTIAIIAGGNNPNLAADLHAYDQQFGLADPQLTIVNADGSSTDLPPVVNGWEGEMDLDVESAHAVAPGANILVVEEPTPTGSGMLQAIDFARNYPGVSVISNSSGGAESSLDLVDDSHFTTPEGHQGVTFFASTGDNGEPSAYPALSPNVVGVGGTTLQFDANYNYTGEVGWSGSGGGISIYQSQPAYQQGVVTQSSTQRTNPDVAWDADPSTGIDVYDSYRFGTADPWTQVGGTSLSSPMMAALVAIADQGRTLEGLGTLDGPTQTLPDLYAMPSAAFHDITSGNNGYAAGSGYDLVTGLGSPNAPTFVQDLLQNWVFTATSATPGQQAAVTSPPASFTITFSDPVDAATVSAGDFTVDSIAADSVTLTSSTTAVFAFNRSPVTAVGVQTIALAGGTIERAADSLALAAYSTTFIFDPTPLEVLSITPAAGSTVAPPLTSLTLSFNAPISPSMLSDYSFSVSQGTILSYVVFNNATQIQVNLSGVSNYGTLDFWINSGVVTDLYGDPNESYFASFTIDPHNVPLTLVSSGLQGSAIYDASGTYGIVAAGDNNTFSFAVAAGQTVALDLTGMSTLQATATLTGGIAAGSASAASPGQPLVIQPVFFPAGGTATITVGGLSGTIGSYGLSVYLNAAIDEELGGIATNNTIATAQNIDGSFLSAGGIAASAGVVGSLATASDVDYFSVTLAAGDTLGMNLFGNGTASVYAVLYNSAGTRLDTASNSGFAQSTSTNYIATTAGLYYVQVYAPAAVNYTLLVRKNEDLDDQTNNTIATAQALSSSNGLTQTVVGNIGPAMVENFDSASELSKYTASGTDDAGIFSVAAHDGTDGLWTGGQMNWIYGNSAATQASEGQTISAWIQTPTSGYFGSVSIGVGTAATYTVSVEMYVRQGYLEINSTQGTGATSLLAYNLANYQLNTWYRLEMVWGVGGIVTANLYASDGYTLVDTISSSPQTNITSGNLAFSALDLQYIDSVAVSANNPVVGHSPTYSFLAVGGNTVAISTGTPDGGSGQPGNLLDPELLVYNSSGTLLATDDNSGADGRNASLTFVAPTSGTNTYYVSVVASPLLSQFYPGDYELSVEGGLSTQSSFGVLGTSIGNDDVLTAAPGQLTVNFSSSVLASSLTSGSLTVDGQPATAVTLTSATTAVYTLPALAAGTQVVSISTGAVQGASGGSNVRYGETFYVDAGPSALTIPTQTAAESATTTIALTPYFSDPLFAAAGLVYQVIAESNASLFSSLWIDAAGNLHLVAAAGLTGSAQFAVEATNPLGQSVASTFNATVPSQVNAAPTITVPITLQLAPNASLTFSNADATMITLADVDGGLGIESLALSVTHGTLNLGTTSGLAGVSGNGTGSITATGTISALNSAVQGMLFTPAAGFLGTAQLELSLNDNGNTGSGGSHQVSQTLLVQVQNAVQIPLDIDTIGAASNPSSLVTIGSETYFAASDVTHGSELWETNGTAAGTMMVSDIYPGYLSSSPANLTNVNGALFFTATDPIHGTELWKSDGTAAGTVLVDDVDPGTGSSSPANLTNVNGELFFTANDGTHGVELWKSNGTAAGTLLVSDINAGTASSSPSSLTSVNGELFFAATTAAAGTELWKSNGTTGGTVLVADINAGAASSSPANLTNVNGVLFFSATTSTAGTELWKSDGTTAGTVLVADINSGTASSSPSNLTNVNGVLFFSATTSTAGTELWKSDGTSAGTVLVDDINAGTGSSSPSNLTNVNGTLFFSATTSTAGTELWESNGTTAGTTLVKDINSGTASSSPSNLRNINGELYFSATTSASAVELWESNGTSNGTVMIKDIYPGNGSSSPSGFVALGNEVLFAANDGTDGNELWITDGTTAGTSMLDNIKTGDSNASPTALAAVGNTVYFQAFSTSNGLWKSDGTAAGTSLVYANITIGSMIDIDGELYFSGTTTANGTELWKSDGTTAGTMLVDDIVPGSGSSSPANLTNVNGTLFFTATTSAAGTELWKSDGTTAGTVMVDDINLASASSSPANLTNVNGELFFSATTLSAGTELWKSDGTTSGTTMVADMVPGSGSSNPANFLSDGGELFFTATTSAAGTELWESDGTTAGTTMVDDIDPGTTGSSPSSLASYNGLVYFAANDGTHGSELWETNGTAAGTQMVKDIFVGGNASPANLTVFDGYLYFSATDAATGNELWRTDGTAAGTVRVDDIYAGSSSSSPGNFRVAGNALFFTAADAAHATELWETLGTAATTHLVRDIFPGNGGSVTSNLTAAGSQLFFSANDPYDAVELWTATAAAAPTTQPIPAVDVGVGTASTTIDLASYFTDDFDQSAGLLYSVVGDSNPNIISGSTMDGNTGTLSINLAANAVGSSQLTIEATDSQGLSSFATVNVNVSGAPTVVGAYVSGSGWSSTYLNMLDAASLGSSAASGQGFELASGASQLTTMLGWSNLNQISIAFSEPVNVSQTSLTLYNSTNTAIAAAGFSYNSSANIATWQFATTLAANKYLLNLAAASVTDSLGTQLDGDWTTSVSTFASGSGDGTPGGDFNFYFNVLPGDANSSGSVTNGDVLITKLQVGAVSNASNYQLDVNASGSITNADVLLEKLQVGSNINSFSAPQLPPQSAATVSVSASSPADATASADDLVDSDSAVATIVLATAPNSPVPAALPATDPSATTSVASLLVVSPGPSATAIVATVPSSAEITPARPLFVPAIEVPLPDADSSAALAVAPPAALPIAVAAGDAPLQSPPESGDAPSAAAQPSGAPALLFRALDPTSSSPAQVPVVAVAGVAAPTSRPAALPAADSRVPASLVVLDLAHSVWRTGRPNANLPWDAESDAIQATAPALTDAALAGF